MPGAPSLVEIDGRHVELLPARTVLPVFSGCGVMAVTVAVAVTAVWEHRRQAVKVSKPGSTDHYRYFLSGSSVESRRPLRIREVGHY